MKIFEKKCCFLCFLSIFSQKNILNIRSNILFLLCILILPISLSLKAQVPVHKRTGYKNYCIYKIKAGDTLFSISHKYQLSLKKLVLTNKVHPPYKLLAGQKIYLPRNRYGHCPTPLTKGENRGSHKSELSVEYKENNYKERLLSRRNIHWIWPVKNYIRVTNGFSESGLAHQALVLQVKRKTNVDTAAAGVVIYAGDNVSGYGKLIIIEHNRSYLSIYISNAKLFVYKGDVVKAGQKIAETGSTGMQEPKLHFEIRRNGKPVDPLHYLPKR